MPTIVSIAAKDHSHGASVFRKGWIYRHPKGRGDDDLLWLDTLLAVLKSKDREGDQYRRAYINNKGWQINVFDYLPNN